MRRDGDRGRAEQRRGVANQQRKAMTAKVRENADARAHTPTERRGDPQPIHPCTERALLSRTDLHTRDAQGHSKSIDSNSSSAKNTLRIAHESDRCSARTRSRHQPAIIDGRDAHSSSRSSAHPPPLCKRLAGESGEVARQTKIRGAKEEEQGEEQGRRSMSQQNETPKKPKH